MRTPYIVLILLTGCATVHVSDAALHHNQLAAETLADAVSGGHVHDPLALDDAEARLRLALELDPDLPEAHANLGLVLFHRGDIPGARASLRHALELDSELASAHVGLGLIDAERAPEVAMAAFERALALQPELAEPRHDLVVLLLQARRYPEARTHALRLLQLEGDRVFAYTALVVCERQLGRPDAALARLEAAHEEGLQSPSLEMALSMVFAELGALDLAIQVSLGLVDDPEFGPMARVNLAALYIDTGDRTRADQALDSLTDGDPAVIAVLRNAYGERFGSP